MRGSWRVVFAAFTVVVAAALVYALSESALQMRALLDGTPAADPPAGRAAVSPSAATAPAPNETSAAVDVPAGNAAAPDEDKDAQRFEGPDAETELEGSPAGPPSGAEFAELLEGDLAGEADPAAVEALRRALREAAAPEQ